MRERNWTVHEVETWKYFNCNLNVWGYNVGLAATIPTICIPCETYYEGLQRLFMPQWNR